MKPSLDYYTGRQFVEIVQGVHPEDWSIKLAGGVLINNKDQFRTTAPADLDGTSLLRVEFASDVSTFIYFGQSSEISESVTATVELTAPNYTIADPNYSGGDEVYPQVPDEVPVGLLPPDPSPDRVASGPSGP